MRITKHRHIPFAYVCSRSLPGRMWRNVGVSLAQLFGSFGMGVMYTMVAYGALEAHRQPPFEYIVILRHALKTWPGSWCAQIVEVVCLDGVCIKVGVIVQVALNCAKMYV